MRRFSFRCGRCVRLYDAGGAQLKSISAYRRMNLHSDLDPDNSPVTVLDDFDWLRQHQISQELQATGDAFANRLKWVLGAYYFHEVASQNFNFNLLTPLFGSAFGFTDGNDVINDSLAGYGQGTWSLTSKLSVTTGVRYTHDKKKDERNHVAFPSSVPIEPSATQSAGSNDVSPRLGFEYQWNADIMTYVSVAKGYKAGGFNGRASSNADFTGFSPEKVWTYELGLRSDLADRRVRLNATAFYSDYSQLQLQISGSTIANGAPQPFNIVSNIPKARITGGELELNVVPVQGLTLSSGLGLTYGKYGSCPATRNSRRPTWSTWTAGLLTLRRLHSLSAPSFALLCRPL